MMEGKKKNNLTVNQNKKIFEKLLKIAGVVLSHLITIAIVLWLLYMLLAKPCKLYIICMPQQVPQKRWSLGEGSNNINRKKLDSILKFSAVSIHSQGNTKSAFIGTTTTTATAIWFALPPLPIHSTLKIRNPKKKKKFDNIFFTLPFSWILPLRFFFFYYICFTTYN